MRADVGVLFKLDSMLINCWFRYESNIFPLVRRVKKLSFGSLVMSSIASPYFAFFADSTKVNAVMQYGITGFFFFLGPLTTLGLAWFTKTFVSRLYWCESKKCLIIQTVGLNGGARYTMSAGQLPNFDQQTGLYNFTIDTAASQLKRFRNQQDAGFYINEGVAFEQGNERLAEMFKPLTDKVALFAKMDEEAIEEAAKHGVHLDKIEVPFTANSKESDRSNKRDN